MKRIVVLIFVAWLGVQAGWAQTLAGGSLEMQGFGQALAVGEGEVFVGEPLNVHVSGVVYRFERGEGGAWTQGAALTSSRSTVGDHFGTALALDAGRLLVGAGREAGGVGAAYLFERDENAWRESARLSAPAGSASDLFGSAVALAGDVAVVGAPGGAGRAGRAFVFRRDGATWQLEDTLSGPEDAAEAHFGEAVAVEGEWIFVGAPRVAENAGRIYAFRFDAGMGGWSEAGVLVGSGVEKGNRFGEPLAARGGRLLAGVARGDGGVGAVYAFAPGEDGQWTEEAVLRPFDAHSVRGFGSAVAFDGQTAWVGAPWTDRGTGRLFAYAVEDGKWRSAERAEGGESERGDRMGAAVAGRHDVAVAGLTGDDYGAGTALIFERKGGAWVAAARIIGTSQGMAAVRGGRIPCEGGAAEAFDCSRVDLLSFLPIQEMGGGRGVHVNDIWGWTDPVSGKEWVLVGRVDGTSFVDVTDPYNPVYAGDLPMTEGARGSAWRDVKVYRDHAFIVADNAGAHGMQIFDLTRLRDVRQAPVTFTPSALYDGIFSAHNIVVNEQTGFAFAVGSSGGGETCGGGLHMIDVREPKAPAFAGCFSDPTTGRRGTGYTHDAQCVVYQGPDAEHRGREVCFGANETALSIADVSDKKNPLVLARAEYPNAGYTHQGWLTEDQRYFFINDELDELNGNVSNTRTLIWDVSDLDDPQLVREFLLDTQASDHNLYIQGRYMYQSNYASGLRIFDVSDPANPVPAGHFDTVPFGSDGPGFIGSWSNYPYFKSGVIAVTSIGEGLFLVRLREEGIGAAVPAFDRP